MAEARRPQGRPGRYAAYEAFEAKLTGTMKKRPAYFQGIGLFRGSRSFTVWLKIHCPHGGTFGGQAISPGKAIEIKLGNRTSWDWPQLIEEQVRMQGLADRDELHDKQEVPSFAVYAQEWLDRKSSTLRSFGVTKGNVNSALKPTFGKKLLNAITVADVDRWIGKQSATLKPSAVQRQLNTFNAIMNAAVRSGLIERNPSSGADKIKGIEARQRFVTQQEWQKILTTVDKIEQDHEERKESAPHRIRGWLTPRSTNAAQRFLKSSLWRIAPVVSGAS